MVQSGLAPTMKNLEQQIDFFEMQRMHPGNARRREQRYTFGMNTHAPSMCEFDTTEAKISYDVWLRAKVARNLAAPGRRISHDEVERRVAEQIAALKARNTTR